MSSFELRARGKDSSTFLQHEAVYNSTYIITFVTRSHYLLHFCLGLQGVEVKLVHGCEKVTNCKGALRMTNYLPEMTRLSSSMIVSASAAHSWVMAGSRPLRQLVIGIKFQAREREFCGANSHERSLQKRVLLGVFAK